MFLGVVEEEQFAGPRSNRGPGRGGETDTGDAAGGDIVDMDPGQVNCKIGDDKIVAHHKKPIDRILTGADNPVEIHEVCSIEEVIKEYLLFGKGEFFADDTRCFSRPFGRAGNHPVWQAVVAGQPLTHEGCIPLAATV